MVQGLLVAQCCDVGKHHLPQPLRVGSYKRYGLATQVAACGDEDAHLFSASYAVTPPDGSPGWQRFPIEQFDNARAAHANAVRAAEVSIDADIAARDFADSTPPPRVASTPWTDCRRGAESRPKR